MKRLDWKLWDNRLFWAVIGVAVIEFIYYLIFS